MQIRNFNNELKTANIMFSRLFRNMRITRSEDSENQEKRVIDVPVVIADRSRIFKNLENYLAASSLTLPLITVQRTGITMATGRNTNLHNEIRQQEIEGRINYNLYSPVPLDITYSVVFVSRWMNDLDMMLGQVLPFFNTDVYVSHRHPKYYNVKYSSQVVMGTSINIESNPEISNEQDEIHTATLEFTYKTHIFGGMEQKEMGVINPYIAPITKISAEVHAVPYLEPDSDNVSKNEIGLIGSSIPNGSDIPKYFNQLDDGKIPYPDYEQIDWIMDYQWNEETGEWELPYDPNEPYGYTPEKGDGLTYVNHRHRLYDQEVEITPDHMREAIQSQNYVNQWGMPYRPIETRPWEDTDIMEGPTESQLQSENPMGTDDYTKY